MPPKAKLFMDVLACPVCGHAPHRKEVSLGKPGGRGYPGNFIYGYVCECCGLLKGDEVTDIYVMPQEAVALAKESWNEKAKKVQGFINAHYNLPKEN